MNAYIFLHLTCTKTFNVHLDLVTGLEKVVTKVSSCPCCSSSLFTILIQVKGKLLDNLALVPSQQLLETRLKTTFSRLRDPSSWVTPVRNLNLKFSCACIGCHYQCFISQSAILFTHRWLRRKRFLPFHYSLAQNSNWAHRVCFLRR